tara:strand:- start:25 stop:624 length:600 start_codon:yes stop_codon:yes gene_type:complete
MEKLALTCRILYDADILNKMEQLDRGKTHPVIVFNDLFEYFNNAKKFQLKIRNGITIILSHENCLNELKENLDIVSDFNYFFSELFKLLSKELLIFTKNKHTYWCKKTAINILNSVKGGLKGLHLSLNPEGDETIEVTEEMITNMSLCVIFNIIGNHDIHQGLFDQISYFKCDICKKIKNEVILLEKQVCENCINKSSM